MPHIICNHWDDKQFQNSTFYILQYILNSKPVWIAENCNILLNKNFLKNIPFSLNSQLQFAPGYFLTSRMIQNPPIPRFWFNMILQYYFIAVLLSIQTERGHDFPFANTMTTLWSRYIRRAAKISVHYRLESQFTCKPLHPVNIRWKRSRNYLICRDKFLLFKILWHMQKSQTMHLHMTCRSDFKNKQTLVLHTRLSWQLKAISK